MKRMSVSAKGYMTDISYKIFSNQCWHVEIFFKKNYFVMKSFEYNFHFIKENYFEIQ